MIGIWVGKHGRIIIHVVECDCYSRLCGHGVIVAIRSFKLKSNVIGFSGNWEVKQMKAFGY